MSVHAPGKKRLEELAILRGFACLAVLVMHAVNRNNASMLLPELEKLALFATPLFVFLASFLLFYSYPDKLPERFLRKRLTYIAIPYLLWSFIYTTYSHIYHRGALPGLKDLVIQAATGQYHIYFILIIVQFYLLFMLILRRRWAGALTAWPMVAAAFVLNAGYLWGFAATSAPWPSAAFLWDRSYYLLFPAWGFYFLAGGALARHYEPAMRLVQRYKWGVLAVLAAAAGLVLQMNGPVTSKRLEVLIYTAAVIPVLFWAARSVRGRAHWLQVISAYSFGIYLSHPLFFRLAGSWFSTAHPWLYFAQALVVQAVGGFLLTWLVSRLPYGSLLVGKVPGVRGWPRRKRSKKLAECSTTASAAS
ncbi:hypothetical protein DUZ99_15865 [Xylanibacillus composti]|uniref:Acyltransferase n=1 Tax=Xylanibacillus composti TaxID=1572762 RepID=A0A8J4M4Y4_9BACL|nr:acyltransferase family protein [Xylanibacillus composti]MDT9726459.1 hypothetical protein [Xylanibacillus composti]GIQ71391.1 acyltransferase [Xylanibacillus composti]